MSSCRTSTSSAATEWNQSDVLELELHPDPGLPLHGSRLHRGVRQEVEHPFFYNAAAGNNNTERPKGIRQEKRKGSKGLLILEFAVFG